MFVYNFFAFLHTSQKKGENLKNKGEFYWLYTWFYDRMGTKSILEVYPMQKLPKGYYAIQADFENAAKDCFTYKGVCYEVEEGVNLFATAPEADAEAPKAE